MVFLSFKKLFFFFTYLLIGNRNGGEKMYFQNDIGVVVCIGNMIVTECDQMIMTMEIKDHEEIEYFYLKAVESFRLTEEIRNKY